MARRLSPPTLLSTTSNTIAVSSSRLHLVGSKYYVYTWRQWEVKVWCLFSSVYHEDANAPQRHHRHREEPKARPLRVGDTEKPAPEGKKLWSYSPISDASRNNIVKISFKSSNLVQVNICLLSLQYPPHPTTANAPTMKRPQMITIMRSSRRWIEDTEELDISFYGWFFFTVHHCK